MSGFPISSFEMWGFDSAAKEKKPAKKAKAPKPAKPPRLRVRTDDAIALVTKALSERYPTDNGGKPALLIAHLPDGQKSPPGTCGFVISIDTKTGTATIGDSGPPVFYIAAQRFMGPGKGEGRTNVHTVTDGDLDAAIAKMSAHLATSVDHQAELSKAVAK